jgi:hypothetical protein
VSQWLVETGVKEPRLRQLAAYWDRLRGDRPLPQRREIEPWHFPALLPYIWLWGLEPGTRCFRLGLAGEEICALIGHHQRGTPLDRVVPPSVYPSVMARYLTVVDSAAAGYLYGNAVLTNDLRLPAQWLILPLGGGDGRVTDIIGVTLFHRRGLLAGQGECRFIGEELHGRFLPLLAPVAPATAPSIPPSTAEPTTSS